MSQYGGGLAGVYDFLVSGVDFEGWVDYLEQILGRFGRRPFAVLDLACGTGNISLPLARRGYRVTGVDKSFEMIEIARAKARDLGLKAKFLVADMRSFEHDGTAQLVTCFHDGLNYLLEFEELKRVFQRVSCYLETEGLFIFDLNSLSWLGFSGGGESFEWEDDSVYLKWKSGYNHFSSIWEINLTFIVKEEGKRCEITERHLERGYTPDEVGHALSDAGLELLAVYDAFSFNPVHEGSKRHFYVARKPLNATCHEETLKVRRAFKND